MSITIATHEGTAGEAAVEVLLQAGFGREHITRWQLARPARTTLFAPDSDHYARYWQECGSLLERLPQKAKRSPAEQVAATALLVIAREARRQFLEAHTAALYSLLTEGRSRFVRVEELTYAAGERVAGLTPSRTAVAAEMCFAQRDKDGIEIDQGLFASHILAHPACGLHLIHAMLLPKPDSTERLTQFDRAGHLDLEGASVTRLGKGALVTMQNPRYLNAEDQTTLDAMETAVDVATLDPKSEVGVLRGGLLENPKYQGKRAFGTGINLTHLYYGRVPFMWYLTRELGFVHKFYRGLARPDITPDETTGDTIEKPWIAAVEAFAIGGHCQYLLTLDYIIAADNAFMTLPARKEGIIPGAANMRLPRFVGDRIARQAIMAERRIDCDSDVGRMICDEIVAPDQMDATVAAIVDRLTNSGVVSASSNRRAFRVVQEPLDTFRRYCAVYAREQAYCHFSPALIGNLERYWNAQTRKM